MVRIWCFNRLKVKQNTGRAGQDQSTWILSGRASIFNSLFLSSCSRHCFTLSLPFFCWCPTLIHFKSTAYHLFCSTWRPYEKYVPITPFTKFCLWPGHCIGVPMSTSSRSVQKWCNFLSFCTVRKDTRATTLGQSSFIPKATNFLR